MIDAHVVPCDNRNHDESRECWCAPNLERNCDNCTNGCWKCRDGRVPADANADEPLVVTHHWLGDPERDDGNGPWVVAEPDTVERVDEPFNVGGVNSGWLRAEVECDICLREWVAYYPETCERLECPGCGYMTTAPTLDDDSDDDEGEDGNERALAF